MTSLALKNASPVSDRGRDAKTPWQMPPKGWKDVLLRTWRESSDDNVGLVSAGVAFYAFLALVPLLAAMVLSYGLVAEPRTVIGHVQSLTNVMPKDAAKLIGEQLLNVVQQSGGKKGLGILVSLAVAVFGARNAAGAIITALNIAYEEKEKRGFLMVNLLALGMTLGAVIVGLAGVAAVSALAFLEDLLPAAPDALLILGKILAYAVLVLAAAAVSATLFRYGPSRQKPEWQWISAGSLFTAVGWLLLTLGFGFYVSNFGSYDRTYGSLGAVIVLLTWMYLSSYVLLLGGELNSELEHQTAHDTTDGAHTPLGTRGAWAADHVASDDGSEAQRETVASPTASSEHDDGAAVAIGTKRPQDLRGGGDGFAKSLALAAAGLLLLRLRGQRSGATATRQGSPRRNG